MQYFGNDIPFRHYYTVSDMVAGVALATSNATLTGFQTIGGDTMVGPLEVVVSPFQFNSILFGQRKD